MRAAFVTLLCLSLGLPGCRACSAERVSEVKDAAVPSVAQCTPRTGEHLGILFAKLCPQDLAGTGAVFEPFWIAAQQLGCSAGEHDTLRCPTVTALQHPAPGEERAPSAARRSLAAVVESNIAQSVCYMRFGGRLPTRQERARAEAAMGLASVIVSQSAGTPRNFELMRLAEWVTETPCQTSNAAGCSPSPYPSGPRRPIPWDGLASCEGTPLSADAGAVLLALGEICPAPDFTWDGGAGQLPCAVRSPATRASVAGFALSCSPPEPAKPHPEDDVSKTAAFRCVLPGTATLPSP